MGEDVAAKDMKKVFIIGGLSPLGKATATQLVAAGHHVEFTGTDQDELDALDLELRKETEKKELPNSTPWRRPYLLDMANLKRLNNEFEDKEIVKKNFDFDIVVVTWDTPNINSSDWTNAELHRFFRVGVLAPFFLIRRLLNTLPKTKKMRFLFLLNIAHVQHRRVKDEDIDAIWNGLEGNEDKDFDKFFSKTVSDNLARARAELGLAIIAKYVVGEHPDDNVKAVVVQMPDMKYSEDDLEKEAKDICKQVLKEFSTWAYPIYPRCYPGNIMDPNRCLPFIDYVIRKIQKYLGFTLSVRYD